MRDVVKQLMAMGPIPAYDDATVELLDRYGELLDAIERPVTDEEAMALVQLFSPDDPGGINWTIIHIVETAPNWPLREFLKSQPPSEFIETLIIGARNGRKWNDD
jgi:hypothetical protein